MPTETEHYVVERSERPVADGYEVEHGERNRSMLSQWSPAQLVGMVAGIGTTVLGFVALARTGFNTDNIYSPHALAWRLPHSPLMALIEVGFGVLLIVGSVVPGGVRSLIALLGAVALSFGIVVVSMTPPDRLNHWLGVEDKNGWFFVVVGGVLLLAGFVSPVFTTRTHKHVVRDEQRVLA
jgi:apolipoprotein N-acyltransferase